MRRVFWWLLQCLLSCMACFFLAFGISLLIEAFNLKNPFYFVMTIFASNLIILISATLLVGILYRMYAVGRLLRKDKRTGGNGTPPRVAELPHKEDVD